MWRQLAKVPASAVTAVCPVPASQSWRHAHLLGNHVWRMNCRRWLILMQSVPRSHCCFAKPTTAGSSQHAEVHLLQCQLWNCPTLCQPLGNSGAQAFLPQPWSGVAHLADLVSLRQTHCSSAAGSAAHFEAKMSMPAATMFTGRRHHDSPGEYAGLDCFCCCSVPLAVAPWHLMT